MLAAMLGRATVHSCADARAMAKHRLPWMVFDYIDGAAGDGVGEHLNREALQAIRLQVDRAVDEGTATAVRLKRSREDGQEVYRRCKTARQRGLRVMLAGSKGREVGESGEPKTG
eukprot:1039716-Prorocentrum_minimum.AAC.1